MPANAAIASTRHATSSTTAVTAISGIRFNTTEAGYPAARRDPEDTLGEPARVGPCERSSSGSAKQR